MVCPYCAGQTDVFNSRLQKKNNSVWRRRRCRECGAVFTSIESLDLGTTFSVRHAGGSLVPFSRDKLYASVYESCRHQKDAHSNATALTQTIIAQLLKSPVTAVVPAADISAIAAEVLARFDNAAGVHYAAFHPSGGS
jgi:transcriptional repressor NrdR